MNIAVLGANGKVGRTVVAELLSRGHKVTAIVHSNGPEQSENLRVVKADVYDPSSFNRVFGRTDAVICTLGSWGTKRKDVVSTGASVIVPIIKKSPMPIISLTGNGAYAPGELPSFTVKMMHRVFKLIAPKILQDGEEHIRILSASNLDWTVVRSPAMLPWGRKSYRLHKRVRPFDVFVSRKSVAMAMIDLAEKRDWSRRAPVISRR